MLVIEPSAKSMSTFATLTEQEAGTTASKHSMSANAPASAACEAEFLAYLQNTAKLADKTCVSYVSSIRSAERYAIDNGYLSHSLFNEDKEKIIATASELYSDPDFISYNDNQHNRFSAAINKLLEFIGADIPEKAAASLGKRHNNQITAPAEANSEIVAVLKQHYEYGFKYDSIRELMRFRQFADEMGITLPEEDEALKTSILSSGTVIDDKVYCKSDDMLQELQRIVDDILSSGAVVIYYESLFENKQEWMESHVITSPDMLKEYLQYNISGCSFSKKFMVKGSRCSEKDAVTDELKRIWGVHPVESVYRLSDRLPYIPIGNIWRVISGNDLLYWPPRENICLSTVSVSQKTRKKIFSTLWTRSVRRTVLLHFATFLWAVLKKKTTSLRRPQYIMQYIKSAVRQISSERENSYKGKI